VIFTRGKIHRRENNPTHGFVVLLVLLTGTCLNCICSKHACNVKTYCKGKIAGSTWMATNHLAVQHISYHLPQEVFVRKVTKMIENRKEDAQEVLKGWFTQELMKTELKWSSMLGCINFM